MSLRILISSINYAPELTATGKYAGETAEWLASRGHEVRVFAAPPFYPEWRVAAGYSGWRYRRETLNGVRVLRCPVYVPEKHTGIKRLLHFASFAFSSFIPSVMGWAWKPDAVMVIAPTILAAPAALISARLARAGSWLHVQDFEVDMAFSLGQLNSRRFHKLSSAFERSVFRRFRRVSTISPRMLEKLDSKGVSADRRVLFPNWVDTGNIRPTPVPDSLRSELGIPDGAIVALYAGNMGEKQGLELLVEVINRMKGEPTVQFVMCGRGAVYPRLREQTRGLANVLWLPPQPYERLNELLNLGDIHLLPQRADAADLVMPSKLTGIFASGRPVVATAHTGTQVAEAVENRGRVVPPDDVDAFVGAIRELAGSSTLRESLGNEAREFAVRHLDRDVILAQVEKEFEVLSGS
ncbi:MAG: glycosyltransferase WbuB [Pseudomonadota bacterium]|nr:glycosyltransferase WbuB [Pseudomonadota bacterium]